MVDLFLDLPDEFMCWEKFALSLTGVTHRNPDKQRRQELLQYCAPGEQVILEHQPNNKHDPCAIAVRVLNGDQIGWIPAGDYYLARHIVSGGKVSARIQAITGGPYSYEEGNFGCVIEIGKYVPDGLKIAVFEDEDSAIRQLLIDVRVRERTSQSTAIDSYVESLNRIRKLDQDPVGKRFRTVRYPINRLTLLLEREKRFRDCLDVFDWWEKSGDIKGLTAADQAAVRARINRVRRRRPS